MKNIKINIMLVKPNQFPNYLENKEKITAVDAYIYLNIKTGECYADYNINHNSICFDGYQNIILTFKVEIDATHDALNKIFKDNKNNFQQIINGSEIKWRGSNYVAVLNENARDIYYKLFNNGNGFISISSKKGLIGSVNTYLDVNKHLNADLDDFINTLLEVNINHYYFLKNFPNKKTMCLILQHMLLERLYNGGPLPHSTIKYLLTLKNMYSSHWEKKLKKLL
ncbi:hypothetical protein PCNPT3_08550 [Psychromonas sp. CNPT3]|uniref:hypothetical protein n=1 Tax=Psychromonas sp. CNPT3 TaxID=314282 RepID=UPI0002C0C30F|nr:hypothetical protein [Psychromonas sp. CNPT3]AGH81648.1 hypothetical protein PCNPT3_08550 [Psychromonas sp. CNPT3]